MTKQILSDNLKRSIVGSMRSIWPEEVARLKDSQIGKFDKFRTDPAGYIRRVLRQDLTPDQEAICEALMKPPYRVIARSAHSQGKCIGFDEPVTLADGSQHKAGSLVGKTFMMPTLVDGRIVTRKAKAEINRFEDVYELETVFGTKIVRNGHHPIRACLGRFGSGIHPILGDDDWVKMSDLQSAPNGKIWVLAVAEQFSVEGVDVLTDDEVKITAYLTGDGCLRALTPIFTQMPGKQLEEFKQCCINVGAKTNLSKNKLIDHTVIGPNKKKGSNPVTNLMNRLGLMGKNSHTKFVPNEIMSASLRQQAIYLSRLYSTDGWASTRHDGVYTQIGYCSVSETMIRQVQQMLVRHGIHARLNFKKKVKAWQLVLQNKSDVIRFAERIGIFGKETAVQVAYDKCKSSIKDGSGWMRKDNIPGTQWQKIRSVKHIGQQWTVAIEVEETHTFLSPIYEHNTFLGGALVNWFYDCYDPGVCITTAPTKRHVQDLLWKEIRVQRKTRWDFKGEQMPELRDKPGHYAKGYTGNTPEAFHGRHDEHMFFVIDEATGVPEFVWRGIKSMFQPNGKHFWLAMLNPTDTTSTAYTEDTSEKWKSIRLSALNHPNIIAALKGEEDPVPGAVNITQLEEWFDQWFEEVNPADKRPGDIDWPPDWSIAYDAHKRLTGGKIKVLRPGVEGQSRVLGLWPSSSEWAVWSDKAWQAACRTLPGQSQAEISWERLPEIGCDVSHGGGDKTEIITQIDFCAVEHRIGSGWEVPKTANVIIEYAEKWCRIYNEKRADKKSPVAKPTEIPIKIDDGGVGLGVTDTLRSWGFNVTGINNGTTATNPLKYPLMRDQLWFEVVQLSNAGWLDLSRLPQKSLIEMRRQAMAVRFDLTYRGQRQVWNKDKTRKQLGRSPDSMDALNLACCPPQGSGDAPRVIDQFGGKK